MAEIRDIRSSKLYRQQNAPSSLETGGEYERDLQDIDRRIQGIQVQQSNLNDYASYLRDALARIPETTRDTPESTVQAYQEDRRRIQEQMGETTASMERYDRRIQTLQQERVRIVQRQEQFTQELLQRQQEERRELLARSGIKDPRVAQQFIQRSVELQTTNQRNIARRTQEYAQLRRDLRKTSWIIIGIGFSIAGIADVLSIFDLGWVISWLIPAITWALSRRIHAMGKAEESIRTSADRLHREIVVLRQRLRPLLTAQGNMPLLTSSIPTVSAQGGGSYWTVFIRDTIITQLIELIPVVDMLPLYLGQVAKMVIDQNIAYQKIAKSLDQYKNLFQLANNLEQFEINYFSGRSQRMIQAIGSPRVNAAPSSLPYAA
jgi:hypothetical protein